MRRIARLLAVVLGALARKRLNLLQRQLKIGIAERAPGFQQLDQEPASLQVLAGFRADIEEITHRSAEHPSQALQSDEIRKGAPTLDAGDRIDGSVHTLGQLLLGKPAPMQDLGRVGSPIRPKFVPIRRLCRFCGQTPPRSIHQPCCRTVTGSLAGGIPIDPTHPDRAVTLS